ncbi:hypothetical protein MJD09_09425, partial [bacterium]|nr:hypothetical protein [bacterium]
MLAAYRSDFTMGERFSASRLAFLSALLLSFAITGTSQAQNQIVTDHYNIYFSPNAKETARRVAEIAEDVYAPLTTAFNAFDELPRIHIIVHDDVDFSNGFALYYQNKVEIWASDFDFELRGGHNWLKGVVTHELAHIVSMQVASRGFFNFGLLNFGQFNVNPDFSFTLPYLHIATPSWFVEGIAQFETYRIGHDDWDSHRDMLLRMAVLEDDLLSYDQMGVFAGSGLHREMVYNQGFALLKYVLETYGEGKVEQLTRHTGILSFGKAIKKVLGISPGKLYEDWKQDLQQRYTEQVTRIASRARAQRSPQFANLSSRWLP